MQNKKSTRLKTIKNYMIEITIAIPLLDPPVFCFLFYIKEEIVLFDDQNFSRDTVAIYFVLLLLQVDLPQRYA